MRAEGRYGDTLSAEAFAEANADVMARIIANQTGIFAGADASARLDAGANANVAYGSRGGEWNSEVLASIVAEAVAKMEFTPDGGLKTEFGGQLGTIVKLATQLGTDRSHISFGGQFGAGASAVNENSANIDW